MQRMQEQFNVIKDINMDEEEERDRAMKPKYSKQVEKGRAEFKSAFRGAAHKGLSVSRLGLTPTRKMDQSSFLLDISQRSAKSINTGASKQINASRYFLKRKRGLMRPSVLVNSQLDSKKSSIESGLSNCKTIKGSRREVGANGASNLSIKNFKKKINDSKLLNSSIQISNSDEEGGSISDEYNSISKIGRQEQSYSNEDNKSYNQNLQKNRKRSDGNQSVKSQNDKSNTYHRNWSNNNDIENFLQIQNDEEKRKISTGNDTVRNAPRKSRIGEIIINVREPEIESPMAFMEVQKRRQTRNSRKISTKNLQNLFSNNKKVEKLVEQKNLPENDRPKQISDGSSTQGHLTQSPQKNKSLFAQNKHIKFNSNMKASTVQSLVENGTNKSSVFQNQDEEFNIDDQSTKKRGEARKSARNKQIVIKKLVSKDDINFMPWYLQAEDETDKNEPVIKSNQEEKNNKKKPSHGLEGFTDSYFKVAEESKRQSRFVQSKLLEETKNELFSKEFISRNNNKVIEYYDTEGVKELDKKQINSLIPPPRRGSIQTQIPGFKSDKVIHIPILNINDQKKLQDIERKSQMNSISSQEKQKRYQAKKIQSFKIPFPESYSVLKQNLANGLGSSGTPTQNSIKSNLNKFISPYSLQRLKQQFKAVRETSPIQNEEEINNQSRNNIPNNQNIVVKDPNQFIKLLNIKSQPISDTISINLQNLDNSQVQSNNIEHIHSYPLSEAISIAMHQNKNLRHKSVVTQNQNTKITLEIISPIKQEGGKMQKFFNQDGSATTMIFDIIANNTSQSRDIKGTQIKSDYMTYHGTESISSPADKNQPDFKPYDFVNIGAMMKLNTMNDTNNTNIQSRRSTSLSFRKVMIQEITKRLTKEVGICKQNSQESLQTGRQYQEQQKIMVQHQFFDKNELQKLKFSGTQNPSQMKLQEKSNQIQQNSETSSLIEKDAQDIKTMNIPLLKLQNKDNALIPEVQKYGLDLIYENEEFVHFTGDSNMDVLSQFNTDMTHIALNIFETYNMFDQIQSSNLRDFNQIEDIKIQTATIEKRQENVDRKLDDIEKLLERLNWLSHMNIDAQELSFVFQDSQQ